MYEKKVKPVYDLRLIYVDRRSSDRAFPTDDCGINTVVSDSEAREWIERSRVPEG